MISASPRANLTVGVLALQGGVAEHVDMIEQIGARAALVRREHDLTGPDGQRVDALVLPGGESSTIDRLLRLLDLSEPLSETIAAGTPTLGTCAGLIVLANELHDAAPGQKTLGLLDVSVRRGAFGAQLVSTEATFTVNAAGVAGPDGGVRGALIRAPEVVEVGPRARAIVWHGGRVVGVTSCDEAAPDTRTEAPLGGITAISFHPELTGDPAFHRALLEQTEARC